MPSDIKGEKYRFRVRALNSYGWSDYSESSAFDLSQAGARLADSQNVTIVLWVLTPTAVLITLLVFVCGKSFYFNQYFNLIISSKYCHRSLTVL